MLWQITLFVLSATGCEAIENEAIWIAIGGIVVLLFGSGLLSLILTVLCTCVLPRELSHLCLVVVLALMTIHVNDTCNEPWWPAITTALAAIALLLKIALRTEDGSGADG